jgi:hypothetical protein
VLLVVATLVVILTSAGSGSSGKRAATSAVAKATHGAKTGSGSHHASSSKAAPKSAAGAASPAETNVAVLNGTETTGLAHRISANLRQAGYTRATALGGRPPGTNQLTVVEYANGHKADAQGVAHSLGVTQVQPLEPAVASLAGSATVVVVVGADKAATVP